MSAFARPLLLALLVTIGCSGSSGAAPEETTETSTLGDSAITPPVDAIVTPDGTEPIDGFVPPTDAPLPPFDTAVVDAAKPDTTPPPPGSRCAPLPEPKTTDIVVSTTGALRTAINASTPGTTIILEDGTYDVVESIRVQGHSNIVIRGRPGHRDAVRIKGTGAKVGCPDNRVGFFIDNSKNVTISDLTILDMQCHAVQVQGTGSSGIRLHRLTMLDTGQQVVKANAKISEYTDDGIVECSTVGYTTSVVPAGNTYSQGIDVHSGGRWIIRDNVVKNIRSTLPSGMVVAGAISLWNGSFDSIVERNLVIDCWMGIQLGGNSDASSSDLTRTGGFQHSGGIVRNNIVVRALDFGIQLARSRGARVDHNTVWTPGYSNSIETRMSGDVKGMKHVIRNNLVSGVVGLRDGDGDTQVTRQTNLTATADWFVDVAKNDLHLVSTATKAIDLSFAIPLADVPDDFDGNPRPGGAKNDVGADER